MAAHAVRRKPNRLALPVYAGNIVCSLTACTEGRRRILFGEVVEHAISTLNRCALKHSTEVFAFCFMPDHLHLLIHSPHGKSTIDLMRDFKQVTGFYYKKRTGDQLWQKGYHDHILRRDEDILTVARYIFGNPVRAGIVARQEDYAYSGSFAWGREALVEG